MAIEIGALALAIRDQGGDAVLAKLRDIDKKAKDTGSKPVTVPISAPGAAKVGADLGGIDASAKAAARSVTTLGDKLKAIGGIGGRIGLLSDGLKFDSTREAATKRLTAYETYFTKQLQAGNLPVQQRIALEQQLASVRAALAPATEKVIAKQSMLAASIGQVGAALKAQVAFLGVAGAVGGASVFLFDSARAYDDAEAATRKLAASSKLTGAALSDVQRIAKEGQAAFQLTASASAELTARVVRLTTRAGDLNKSGEFMARWLDLAAANGYGAAEAMQALETTLAGQDEGLNRLGLMNPSQIWAKMAAEVGKSVGKLTEAEKWQSIVNEVISQGARVQGEYAKRLDTTAGKAELLRQRTEALKIELGRLFLGVREGVTGGGTSLIGWLTSAVRKFNEADEAGERFWRNVVRRLRGQPLEFAPTTPTAADRARQQGPPNPFTRQPITVTGEPFDAKKAAEEAAKAEAERQALIARQISAVATLVDLRKVDIGTLQTAVRLESTLTSELQRGNLSLERRAEIQQQLNQLRTSGGLIKPLEVRDLPLSFDLKAAKKLTVPVELRPVAKKADKEVADLGMDLGMTLGAALAAGIQQSVSGDATSAIASIGTAILGAIGDMFVSIGVTALAGSKFLAKILASLATLNPFAMAAASIGLIAIGAAIKGAASRAVRGGSGGGSGGFGASSTTAGLTGRETIADAQIRRASLQPGAAGVGSARAGTMASGPTISVIGVESPEGQRLIGRSVGKFTQRGGA